MKAFEEGEPLWLEEVDIDLEVIESSFSEFSLSAKPGEPCWEIIRREPTGGGGDGAEPITMGSE